MIEIIKFFFMMFGIVMLLLIILFSIQDHIEENKAKKDFSERHIRLLKQIIAVQQNEIDQLRKKNAIWKNRR